MRAVKQPILLPSHKQGGPRKWRIAQPCQTLQLSVRYSALMSAERRLAKPKSMVPAVKQTFTLQSGGQKAQTVYGVIVAHLFSVGHTRRRFARVQRERDVEQPSRDKVL